MSMLKEYLRLHRRSLLAAVLAAVLLAIVLWLYQIPAAPVAYWLLLMAAVLGVFVVVDFFAFRRRHLALARLLVEPEVAADYLPEADHLLEADYQALVRALSRQMATRTTEYRAREREQLEYYSLWAHQIKTPIAAMDLLLQSTAIAERGELSEQLFKIEQYVDMALTYQRSEGNDLSLRRQSLDDIIRTAVKVHAKSFIRGKITLDFEETGMQVLTDEKWLAFLLGQLLSNALKYTPAGGTVRIWGEGDRLLIGDTGIGIAADDLPRIFEWGYTGYTGRQYEKSTGIGLFLCRRVARRLSHSIDIQSAVGEGTTVTLDLGSIELEPE